MLEQSHQRYASSAQSGTDHLVALWAPSGQPFWMIATDPARGVSTR